MTDRGTHVPLIVHWPGHIKAGATCDDLIDFSDLFPTLCEMTNTPLPNVEIHGRSFAPQLFGKTGNPREWVHIQHLGQRQVRNSEYMLNNKNELRRVVELWEDTSPPNEKKFPEKEAAARKSLQAVFDAHGHEDHLAERALPGFVVDHLRVLRHRADVRDGREAPLRVHRRRRQSQQQREGNPRESHPSTMPPTRPPRKEGSARKRPQGSARREVPVTKHGRAFGLANGRDTVYKELNFQVVG